MAGGIRACASPASRASDCPVSDFQSCHLGRAAWLRQQINISLMCRLFWNPDDSEPPAGTCVSSYKCRECRDQKENARGDCVCVGPLVSHYERCGWHKLHGAET